MKQTGYLKIDGQVSHQSECVFIDPGGIEFGESGQPRVCVLQRYPAEVTDLISEGEIGSGTCGQVFKVRFKKTCHVIAVKVSSALGFSARSVVADNQ